MHNSKLPYRLAKFSRFAGIFSVVVGCLVLTGWMFDVSLLKSVVSGFAVMKANTAVCFIFSGLSLLLNQHADANISPRPSRFGQVAIALAVVVTVVGGMTLSEYLFNWNAGIDELIFRPPIVAGVTFQLRMSWGTAFNFVLIGSALLLLAGGPRYAMIMQIIAAISMIISLLSLLAYLFSMGHIAELYQSRLFSLLAIHTAFTFTVVSAGLLTLRTNYGWISAFVQDTVSAKMARHFLVATLVTLPLVAELRTIGQNLGWYGTYFGISILTVSSMTILTMLNWLGTRIGNLADAREEQLRLAIEGSSSVLWDWDIATEKIYLNDQWQVMLGGVRHPTVTTIKELISLVHPDDLPSIRRLYRNVLTGHLDHYDIEHRVRTHSGEWKWILSQGKVVARSHAGQVTRCVGTNVDIDERKNAELQAIYRASHDLLTGLPNRAGFHDRLKQAMARSRRYRRLLALLYLDVDKFKHVNDTLGHSVGDELLKAFAQRVSECVRQTDTVARLGGDEFTVILEELKTRDDGRAIAKKIVEKMQAIFVIDRHSIKTTTSIGMAFSDGTTLISPETLIKEADKALYSTKGAGRNSYSESIDI